ncbi:MAG: hypothetical protein J6040_07585 [Clostridiales bacterium]|nr:hypothetical protein [Clostridiales bacterium]
MPDPSVEKPKLNMKEMGLKKSVIHLWTYYKWYAIIPLIIIIVIVSMIHSYISETKKDYLNIAFVNAHQEADDIFKDYEASVGKKIRVDSTFFAPKNDDSVYVEPEMAASVQNLASLLRDGTTDVIFTNARSIKEYGTSAVGDLRKTLSDAQLKELNDKDMILFLTDENGNEVPSAILVTGLPMFEPAYAESDEKHYLMINPFSEKKEETRLLVEYIFFS